MIGLVTDEIASSPFAGRLLRGAVETAWAGDHLVLTIDSGGDPAKEDAAATELLGRSVDGIIHTAMSPRRVRVPEGLHRTHAVLANCLPGDDSLPAVAPAERAGGRGAARLLPDQGHRRPAVIGGLDGSRRAERPPPPGRCSRRRRWGPTRVRRSVPQTMRTPLDPCQKPCRPWHQRVRSMKPALL